MSEGGVSGAGLGHFAAADAMAVVSRCSATGTHGETRHAPVRAHKFLGGHADTASPNALVVWHGLPSSSRAGACRARGPRNAVGSYLPVNPGA